MAFKVEVISKETIKPFSPTPPHLRTFKLSFRDQLSSLVPVTLLVFYAADAPGDGGNDNNNKLKLKLKLNQMKKSLSMILTKFYPFAGRITNNVCIDCNDEGVNFFEARASCELTQAVSDQQQLVDDAGLFPVDNWNVSGPKVLLSIQANLFDCGGMALGICISHKVVDAHSLCFFLTSWAALTLKGDNMITDLLHPKLGMASFFPPNEENIDLPIVSTPTATEHVFVAKRFVFDASQITALKAKCSNNPTTRVEAVCALIWSCYMKVAAVKTKQPSTPVAWVSRNVRGRRPELCDHFIGNLVDVAVAVLSSTTGDSDDATATAPAPDLCYLTGKLQEAKKRNIDMDPRLQKLNNPQIIAFTSWCGFPLYQVDYGWGKPSWLCPGRTTFIIPLNLVLLMDTKCGKGIEAWVKLSQEDMARFEREPDIMAFTTSTNLASC